MAKENVAKLNVIVDSDMSGVIAGMGEATQAVNKFHAANGKAASAFQAGSKEASRFGVIAGQAGYQMQDFAVQISGGQNAMVAFAQQGSQILGVFGPAGAIAGAALAVGVLLARLMEMGPAVKTNAEYAKEATEAWEKYGKTIKDIQFKNMSPEEQTTSRDKDLASLRKRQQMLSEMAALNNELIVNPFSKGFGLAAESFVFPTLEQQTKYFNAVKDARKRGVSTPSSTEDRFGGGAISVAFSNKDREALDRMQEMISKAQGEIADQAVKLADGNRDDKVKKDEAAEQRLAKFRQSQTDFLTKLQMDASSKVQAALKKDEEALAKSKERILLKSDAMYKLKADALKIGRTDLTAEQKDRALDQLLKPTALPQALQVNAGASALGGTVGEGGAVLEAQRQLAKSAREQTDILRRMLQLWSTGSN